MILWKHNIALGPTLYGLWTALAVGVSSLIAGLSSETITRLLVLGFLLIQIAYRDSLSQVLPRLAPKNRFILLGTSLAAVVEGFHMISKPVFDSLRIDWNTPITQGLLNYAIDLLFTVPAYLAIFSVIWYFINRYPFTLWRYIILIGLAQTLGDGGLFFFLNSPGMLLFLPYPMTNYHAINIIPFLAVRDYLKPGRSSSVFAYLAVPGIIGAYLICGAVIIGARID